MKTVRINPVAIPPLSIAPIAPASAALVFDVRTGDQAPWPRPQSSFVDRMIGGLACVVGVVTVLVATASAAVAATMEPIVPTAMRAITEEPARDLRLATSSKPDDLGEQCVADALEAHDECGEKSCSYNADRALLACATETPALCADAPSPADANAVTAWLRARCEPHQRFDRECSRLMTELHERCIAKYGPVSH